VSPVRFGIGNPVPINLLMITLILGGLVSGQQIRRQFFPEVEADTASVSLPYPGATPAEIEETLAIKVEDSLIDLDEVKDLYTTVSEGGGRITVRIHEGADIEDATDEIERAVDALLDLPEEAETIEVSTLEPRLPVIRLVVYGDTDEQVLKRAIRAVREDLRSLPNMGQIVTEGVRDYEIRVDVQSHGLIQHGLSLPEVARRIGAWMKEVPGGTVKTSTGNVRVRTMGVVEREKAIRDVMILAEPDGRFVRLGDIAEVSETFVDDQLINRFNEKPSAGLTIFKMGDQDIVNIAQMARAYVLARKSEPLEPSLRERLAGFVPPGPVREALTTDRLRAWELGANSRYPLPGGTQIAVNSDLARFVEGRLDLLLRNATYGAVLVFATLLVFLNWRVSMWVGMGLVTAVMGTVMLMYLLDITLNLLTMFGLIVVLGLLVDDAIVVSENVQAHHDRGEPSLIAAFNGTREVQWPVVATVLTSIVAFLPLKFIKGQIGDLLGALPMVVACALFISLVESLMILPSHMGHSLTKRDALRPGRFASRIRRLEIWRDRVVLNRIVPAYAGVLRMLLRVRYLTIAVMVSVLIVTLGMVAGGRLEFVFLPDDDAETIVVDLRMPVGTPLARTNTIVAKIERASRSQSETKSVVSVIGQSINIDTGQSNSISGHVAQMFVELKFVEERDRPADEVIASIQQALSGQIDEVDRISFQQITGGPAGADITVRISGQQVADVEAAVVDVERLLAGFADVHNIANDNDAGQPELRIRLKPGAAALGFTNAGVAGQIRGALYGIDAHVFAREQEDINVRVRADEDSRQSLYTIENGWLISPVGSAVPLSEVAAIEMGETYATINRVNRERAVTITADTDPATSPETITRQMNGPGLRGVSPMDDIRSQHPHLDIEFTGRQEQMHDAFGSLPIGFLIAIVMIYVILAWLFSSYTQPILVLMAIPFATIGVVWGHLLLGYDLTFLSLIGFVALSGIVVNDSLIFVKFFNTQLEVGATVRDSLIAAGRARMRPILLTTITTVLGLTPLILETSFQARFLIPMAISIAMGLLSATVLILILLPCLLLAFDDLKKLAHLLWYGCTRAQYLQLLVAGRRPKNS